MRGIWRILLLLVLVAPTGLAVALELTPAEAAGKRIYLEGVG